MRKSIPQTRTSLLTTRKERVFCADFETRAGDNAIREQETWVWAWALAPIDDFEEVLTGSTIDEFMHVVMRLSHSKVYFHNLEFDGTFILSWLLKNGYEQVFDKKEIGKHSFMAGISDSKKFYTITVRSKKSGTRSYIEFRDSSKKIPGSVKSIAKAFKTKYQKLEIDYVLDRPYGYVMTDEEAEYIKNDVRVMCEAMQTVYNMGLTKMTIGSDALNVYRDLIGGNKQFRKWFPKLSKEEDYFGRKAYRGGWCYADERFAAKTHYVKGSTYDVCSLYPSMLSSTEYTLPDGRKTKNIYPYGEGVKYNGKYVEDEDYPLYVAHFMADFKIKPDHVPTVQLKKNRFFMQNEYIKDSNGIQEIYMTSIDLELFFSHYDIISIKWLDGYKYMGHAGFFDVFIDKYFKIKCTETGALKQMAKNLLNNIYGKFAQHIIGANKWLELDENGIVRYHNTPDEEREPVYIPVGAFCTAYARRFTIMAAQANYDVFAYSDTDSIHLLSREPKCIEIGVSELCKWEWESDWDIGRFVRQKTYYEHTVSPDESHVYKCAGMSDRSKQKFHENVQKGIYTLDDFAVGLTIEGMQLKRKEVIGGIILFNDNYTMRA